MRKIAFVVSILFIVLLLSPVECFSEVDLRLTRSGEEAKMAPVSFLNGDPVIDGKLDSFLASLEKRPFNIVYKSNKGIPDDETSFRLAYDINHFYLYVEVKAEKVICRDRGFQNGDGLVIIFTFPGKSKTGERDYIALGMNPEESIETPYFKFIWGRNGDWPFKMLDEDTKFAVKAENGKVGFELLLPWKDIYPAHPLLCEDIGFNLFFTKAHGERDFNSYIQALGPKMSLSLTASIPVDFKEPEGANGLQVYLEPEKRNFKSSGSIKLRGVSLSPTGGELLFMTALYSGENERLNFKRMNVPKIKKGVDRFELEYDVSGLMEGGYRFFWAAVGSKSKGEAYLSVFPDLDFSDNSTALKGLDKKISRGSYNTIRFMMKDLKKLHDNLRDYLPSFELRSKLGAFKRMIERAKRGEDVLATKKGYVRRAFVSKIDDTLQPYTVRILEEYNPQKKYPVLVFLHGSDRDDRALSNHRYVNNDNYIIIAPNGRGPRTAFTIDNAQADIKEAIADAAENYNIDRERMLVAGFSMGGYGVYRTVYEYPGLFKGAAVFSGHPSLASQYTGNDTHPDFMNEKYLKVFKDMDVKIFHGKKDRNCPYELTDEFVKKLKAAGAKVDYYIDETGGHEGPKKAAALKALNEWMNRLAGEKPQKD